LLKCGHERLDKFDGDRKLRRQNLLPAWVQFRAAVSESVATYNGIEEGKASPATLDDSKDKMLMVSCTRPSLLNRFSMVVVTVKTGIDESAIAIRAEIWKDEQQPEKDGVFEFVVTPETEVALSLRG
jgi:hypothetical protein